MRLLLCLAATAVLASGCSQPSGAAQARDGTRFGTILEAPPRTPILRLGPAPYERTLEDRRFFFADEVEQRHLPIFRRIKAEQMGNLGGVEWRWQDGRQNGGLGQLTGVVFFLRDPSATLAIYSKDPLFKPAKGDFLRQEQNSVAVEWARRIGNAAASAEYGNVRVPRLRVLLPRTEFERRRRAEGWRLPANLEIRLDPLAEPDLPAVAPDVAPLLRAYPQQSQFAGASPDVATFDAVVLRDGCLFIDEDGSDDPLIELPKSVGLFRDAEGHLSFRSRYSKRPQLYGRVGTRLQLGWRVSRTAPPALQQVCKARRIVSVASVDQAAGYAADWLWIKHYAERHRITSAQALARANDCLIRAELRAADARLGRRQRIPANSCLEDSAASRRPLPSRPHPEPECDFSFSL